MTHTDLRITRRRLLQGAAAGAVALGSPLGGYAAAATPKRGGVLNFGLSSYPPNLDPFTNTGTAAATVHLATFRGLLGYDDSGALRSEVAESWKADGRQAYVFELRKNAKFQNGEPVTADDVKYSLDSILAPNSTAFLHSQLAVVERVDVLGPRAIRLVLREPSASLLYLLAEPYAPIVSKKAASASPAELIGCGPYSVKSAEKGSKVVCTRFADFYRAGFPRLDGVNFVAYADDNLRVTALQAGDVDVIEYVPWQAMDALSKNPKLALQTTNGPFMYLLFNTTTGPFAKAEVRQAVGFGINRDEILQAAFFGRGAPLAGLPIQADSPFADKKMGNFWTHDPERARKMLAAAGYPSGFSTTLLSTAQYGMHKDTAQVVQDNLGKIGVKIELKLPDWPTRVALGNKGQYEIAVGGTSGEYNDPDALAVLLSGQPSYLRSYGFNDPQINRLLDEGRTTLDLGKRKQIYGQLQTLALKAAPIVGLSWRSQGYGVARTVEGFRNLPGFLTFYSGYTLDEASVNR